MKNFIILITFILAGSTAVNAQNGGDSAQPPNGLSQIEAYSLFYSDFKSDNYASSLRNGRWILKGMPKSIEGYASFKLSTQMDRFTTIYSELAQNATDPSIKSAYADTVNMIFDKVFANFDDTEIDYYQWHLKRGLFYAEQADFIDDAEAKTTAEYRQAFEMNPAEMAKVGDGYYVRALLQNLVSEGSEESKQEALNIIETVEADAEEELNDYFDRIRNQLFDSPEERMVFLEEKVEENPDDVASMQQLRDIYEDQGMLDKAQDLNITLYEADPSYQNTTALANFAIENANYDDAIKYLKEAETKAEGTEKRKAIYQNLADAYMNKGNLSQARSNARKAIKEDSEWGRPYIQIADIYARAVSNCTSNSGGEMTRNDRAVYWLVLDYLNKAKRADSSVSSVANSRLQSYRQVTPTKEDIFFEDSWSEGSSIRIDSSIKSCYSWINESTTVR